MKPGPSALSPIDAQAAMKAKLGNRGQPNRILGDCNSLGHRVLEAEPDIGLPLRCNLVVRGAAVCRLEHEDIEMTDSCVPA